MAKTTAEDEAAPRLGSRNRMLVGPSSALPTLSSNSHKGLEPAFASESFGRLTVAIRSLPHGVLMPSFFVGIDVAQANPDIHILPAGRALRVKNTAAGHAELLEALLPLAAKPADIRAVVESTGGLELPVALALEEAGLQIAVIKPERARYFARAHGQPAKTDAIDAAILARFVRDIPLAITPLPAEELRHFRDLLDRRNQLVEMKTMESNRLASTHEKRARKSVERHIARIEKEIETLERELDRRIADNAQWKETDRILQSIPGLGSQSSRTLIGQLPELGHCDRKTLGHLVGLAPIANDSGTTEGHRHILGGRKQVRNVLYMAAMVASRCNPLAKALYARMLTQRQTGQGGPDRHRPQTANHRQRDGQKQNRMATLGRRQFRLTSNTVITNLGPLRGLRGCQNDLPHPVHLS